MFEPARRPVSRRTVLSSLSCITIAATSRSWAQEGFPSRALRLVVPAPPGGLSDLVGRLIADALQADLKQTVVVDNRPGAAGLIGTQAVAESPPDGYTVLLTSTSNHILAPLTQKAARVDPVRDLAPVGLALRSVGVFVVAAALPARTLAEFVAVARSRPGQLNFGSAGIGSANHVLTERFKTLAGIDLVHVPYRGGAPMMTAVMAGEVQFALLDFATAELALKAGKARPLAQTGSRRHVALEQVPTLAEAGFKDYDPSFWVGLAVPKATPAAVVEQLNVALNTALGQTAFKARAQALGWTLIGGKPSVMADTVARETASFRETTAGLNLDRQ